MTDGNGRREQEKWRTIYLLGRERETPVFSLLHGEEHIHVVLKGVDNRQE
jgi:hypothetical protein